jgi:hypothetical protein
MTSRVGGQLRSPRLTDLAPIIHKSDVTPFTISLYRSMNLGGSARDFVNLRISSIV